MLSYKGAPDPLTSMTNPVMQLGCEWQVGGRALLGSLRSHTCPVPSQLHTCLRIRPDSNKLAPWYRVAVYLPADTTRLDLYRLPQSASCLQHRLDSTNEFNLLWC